MSKYVPMTAEAAFADIEAIMSSDKSELEKTKVLCDKGTVCYDNEDDIPAAAYYDEALALGVLTDENLGKEYILSQCCHPIPGDEVLGYLDAEGMMHIHKLDCPEAALLKTSYGKRLDSATWNTHRVQSFVETIELKGIDKFGVFIQVLQTITTEFHINMRAIHMSSDDGIFQGTMEIYVYDKSELEDLLKAIKKIDDIKEVRRIDN